MTLRNPNFHSTFCEVISGGLLVSKSVELF